MTEFFLIDYGTLVEDIKEQIQNENGMRRARIVPRLAAFVENARSESLRGDTTLAKLYASLDSCGLTRTSTQRFFHKNFVESILPWIYGINDFTRYKDRILNEAGLVPEKYNQYTLISTPRRWGKTTSVAMFVACALFSVPEIWISVYSTGRRASSALSQMVHKLILKLEEAASYKKTMVLRKNTEELFYSGDLPSDVRQLFSYPCSVQESTRPFPTRFLTPDPFSHARSWGA